MRLRLLPLFFLVRLVQSAERIPPFDVSDGELLDVVRKLRDDDVNRAGSRQLRIDLQGHTSSASQADNAPYKLISNVDTSLFRKPTYERFLSLLDNFHRDVGVAEPKVSRDEERREVNAYLDAAFSTRVWRELYDFLNRKQHPFASDPRNFRRWIANLWFSHYSRARGQPDTSGFEHVFVGEAKNGEVSGLHNWVRIWQLEQNDASFDYRGFHVKRANVAAAGKFKWGSDVKRAGSFLVGSSPEFELALYSLCFLSRRGDRTCDVEIDGCPLSVTSHDISQQGRVYIGSVYPSVGRMTDACRRGASRS